MRQIVDFFHSTCFGHHYVHNQEYKPGSCLCCEVLTAVFVNCSGEQYTHTTAVHTYNSSTHTQQQYTHTTAVHTYNSSTHTQQQYTHTTAVHKYNSSTHIQQQFTHTTAVHTYNSSTHTHTHTQQQFTIQ